MHLQKSSSEQPSDSSCEDGFQSQMEMAGSAHAYIQLQEAHMHVCICQKANQNNHQIRAAKVAFKSQMEMAGSAHAYIQLQEAHMHICICQKAHPCLSTSGEDQPCPSTSGEDQNNMRMGDLIRAAKICFILNGSSLHTDLPTACGKSVE
jgi:exosome complex RNA-binding protein Csl4